MEPILTKEKISEEDLKKAAEALEGYVKVVVDIEKEIMTVGGLRHVEGEELLLQNGSIQENIWGGGLDLETGEVDFDSMINIRPREDNPSREVLSKEIREKMEKIIRKLLKQIENAEELIQSLRATSGSVAISLEAQIAEPVPSVERGISFLAMTRKGYSSTVSAFMKTQDIVLNIAVNLGRISRWAEEGNQKRINKFLEETEDYVKQLEAAPKNQRFLKTFQSFQKHFFELKDSAKRDDAWAEDVLTWGNILTHRAKLS